MTVTDIRTEPLAGWIAAALHTITTAGDGLAAAKRTRSVVHIQCAQRDVQIAVDAARELGVEWGQIGSVLGIARGNAYQRYRRKSHLQSFRLAADEYGHPAR